MKISGKMNGYQSLTPYAIAAIAMLPAISLYALNSQLLLLYVAFLCSVGLGLLIRRPHGYYRVTPSTDEVLRGLPGARDIDALFC